MKKFEIAALGLEDLSFEEAVSTDGGFPVGLAIALVIAGLLISCPTAAKDEGNSDEVYYGGELEPAVCNG